MSKNVVLNPVVGDKVVFFVNEPVQNIGNTVAAREGVVKKVNRKTFTVVDGDGEEHKVAIEYHKRCTYIPTIHKKIN